MVAVIDGSATAALAADSAASAGATAARAVVAALAGVVDRHCPATGNTHRLGTPSARVPRRFARITLGRGSIERATSIVERWSGALVAILAARVARRDSGNAQSERQHARLNVHAANCNLPVFRRGHQAHGGLSASSVPAFLSRIVPNAGFAQEVCGQSAGQSVTDWARTAMLETQ